MADDFDEMIVLPWKVWWRICEVSVTDKYCTKARHGFKSRPSGSQTEGDIFMCIWQDRPTYAKAVKVCFVTLICSSSFVTSWSRLRRRTAKKTASVIFCYWGDLSKLRMVKWKESCSFIAWLCLLFFCETCNSQVIVYAISGKILAFIIMKCPCMDFSLEHTDFKLSKLLLCIRTINRKKNGLLVRCVVSPEISGNLQSAEFWLVNPVLLVQSGSCRVPGFCSRLATIFGICWDL